MGRCFLCRIWWITHFVYVHNEIWLKAVFILRSKRPTNIMLVPKLLLCYGQQCNYIILTYWSWLMHICIGKLTIIGSDNGLSPGQHQAIMWTNAGILLIGPLEANFSEILIVIQTFSWKEICLKMSSMKCCPFWLDLSVLKWYGLVYQGLIQVCTQPMRDVVTK